MKTWVKVYTEINRDPDIGTLTWAQRGIWTALLALAGEIDHRGEDEQETGYLDTIDRVAWSIRCDLEELEEAIQAFEQRGMVARDPDGMMFVPNYPKRQGRPPSSRPSAVAKRVKRHRAKVAEECNDVTGSVQRGVTPSDTDTDPDTEADTDTEKIQTTDRGDGRNAAVAVLEEFGMGEPEKVRLETRLTDAEIVETVAYAQEKELGPGWVRSQLRQNQAHRPRAPDDGRHKYAESTFAHVES